MAETMEKGICSLHLFFFVEGRISSSSSGQRTGNPSVNFGHSWSPPEASQRRTKGAQNILNGILDFQYIHRFKVT